MEAETGVLGSILIDPSIFGAIRETVSSADFFRDTHQIIFRAFEALHEAGSAIDVLTLTDYLRRKGAYEKCGDLETILGMIGGVPHAANARTYAGILKQKAAQRNTIHLAQTIMEDVYSGQPTAEEVIERLRSGVESIEASFARGMKDDLDVGPVEIATLADIRAKTTDAKWLWPGWLIGNHMSAIAAEPATGKTRLAMDLCRRMYHCLPWPDGQDATRPMGTCSLWIASDRTHSEMVKVASEFGLPDDAVYFNSAPSDPFGGIKLDDPREIRQLRRRVRFLGGRLGAIFIDTINKATRRALYRPEEAEAFFGPLIDVAVDLQVPLIAITHLSRSGESLDRRIEGTCRVLIKMAKPDGEENTVRRRLWVAAIRDGVPADAIGVTMGTNGNEYDGAAPTMDQVAPKTRESSIPRAVMRAMDWLREHLSGGPCFASKTLEKAREAGHAERTLFRAIKELGVIKGGDRGNTFYRLRTAADEGIPRDTEGEADSEDEGFIE